jgi:hypothetical protein
MWKTALEIPMRSGGSGNNDERAFHSSNTRGTPAEEHLEDEGDGPPYQSGRTVYGATQVWPAVWQNCFGSLAVR